MEPLERVQPLIKEFVPYRTERRITITSLGKRESPSKGNKVLLHWMKGEPKKQMVTEETVLKAVFEVESPINVSEPQTSKSLRNNPREQIGSSGKRSNHFLEGGLRKAKKYSAEDKRVLAKAEKLIGYWRDSSRQVPIVFRELSTTEDRSQQTVQVVDLSNRKILLGVDIFSSHHFKAGKGSGTAKKKRARKGKSSQK